MSAAEQGKRENACYPPLQYEDGTDLELAPQPDDGHLPPRRGSEQKAGTSAQPVREEGQEC